MNLTKWLLLAVIVGLIIYDVIAHGLGQPTESQVIRDWALASTNLAFTAGFLGGHWCFPRKTVDASGWMYAAGMIVALGTWDLYWFFNNLPVVWYRYPGFYFLLGIPTGYSLWGQRYK